MKTSQGKTNKIKHLWSVFARVRSVDAGPAEGPRDTAMEGGAGASAKPAQVSPRTAGRVRREAALLPGTPTEETGLSSGSLWRMSVATWTRVH